MQSNAAILIPGRDLRSRYCAEALKAMGYAVEDCPVHRAEVIVLPMGVQVPQELLQELCPGQLVLGGCLGSGRAALEAQGVRVKDYYDDSLLQAANAVPTAEGAIAILMDRLPITVQGMNCLITGYGRIGTVLSNKLALLGARVTVSARKAADLGKISAMGLRAEHTGRYQAPLDQYDAIINTVPAAVFSEREYTQIKKDCLLLELASAPGGFAEALCRANGLQYVRAPGLPGRCAPKTAGEAIAQAIVRILDLEESSCDMKP